MTTYWHGGNAGLNPGDLILPRATTGVASWRTVDDEFVERFGLDRDFWGRSDRVYVTRKHAIAWYFAAQFHKNAWVYRVEPAEPMELDKLCASAAFVCPSAVVIDGEAQPLTWEDYWMTLLTDEQRAKLERIQKLQRHLRDTIRR